MVSAFPLGFLFKTAENGGSITTGNGLFLYMEASTIKCVSLNTSAMTVKVQ